MNNNQDIKFHSAAIFVKDIEASKKFYTEILGQTVEMDFGKNVILRGGITLWEIRPNHIIPEQQGRDAIFDETKNRFEFCFETERLDRVFDELKKNDVDFLHPVHEEPWGQRTVRFFDPDRHLIEIGETLKAFVLRLSENMSPEQVAEKTSIPIETVGRLINQGAR